MAQRVESSVQTIAHCAVQCMIETDEYIDGVRRLYWWPDGATQPNVTQRMVDELRLPASSVGSRLSDTIIAGGMLTAWRVLRIVGATGGSECRRHMACIQLPLQHEIGGEA